MEKNFEKAYHQYEKTHFWFRARRKYIVDYLTARITSRSDVVILDVGCSSGILLNELQESGFSNNNLYGVDISERAIENCKKSGIPNAFVMDAQNIELSRQFDVIIASDCLEHLENDEIAIQNWCKLLKKDGILVVFVPAFMFLWSNHDVLNMHHRRYKRGMLKEKLKQNSLEIRKASYWNFFMFFPYSLFIGFHNLTKRVSKKENQNNLGKMSFFNKALFLLLTFENNLLSFMNFPVGVSVFCVAKKKS